MTDHKRYYAFDCTRAIMMFLGVVIHSSMSYSSSNDMSWPLRAGETSVVFYVLVDFIHAFRMPIFFLIAGFFGALLFYDKGPLQMLKNRFKRIFLPFIVFLIILNPFITFTFKYSMAVFDGETPLTFTEHFSSPRSYIPFGLFHLWFLYYLFIISAIMYCLASLTKGVHILPVDNFCQRIFKNPIYRISALTGVSCVILGSFGLKSFETSIHWIPDAGILLYFFAFYTTGWFLYCKKELVNTLKQFDFAITLIGVIAFCLKICYADEMSLPALQTLNSIITCFLSMGIIGLFLRFADTPNKYVSYFVNSAYWVYLIHFPIAVFLSGLLNELSISVYLKFLIVLLGTAVFSLASYNFFVRNTFIGAFLNGKQRKQT